MIHMHEAEGAIEVTLTNGAVLELEDKGDYVVLRTVGKNPSMGAYVVDGRIHLTITANAKDDNDGHPSVP